jgi:hypothetical protein
MNEKMAGKCLRRLEHIRDHYYLNRWSLWYHMVVWLYATVHSVPISTKVVSSNPIDGEVIQDISHLRHVGGYLLVFRITIANTDRCVCIWKQSSELRNYSYEYFTLSLTFKKMKFTSVIICFIGLVLKCVEIV